MPFLLEQHPATRDRINQILGGVSLSEASVWADCAKGFRYCNREPTAEEKAYTQRNPTRSSKAPGDDRLGALR